jgi:hypothetical protein
MAAELGQTDDPKALVPGDVAAVTATMWALRSYGDALLEAGNGLTRIDTQEGWSGAAADQFRDRFQGEPGKWVEAGDSFHSAAEALDAYASTLQWAQQQAGEAIRLWNQAQAATAQAKDDHAHAVAQAEQDAAVKTASGVPTAPVTIPFHDPGEAGRQAARQQLDRARTQLKSAGDTANRTVGQARDKAPERPGFWSEVGDFFSGVGTELENAGIAAVNGVASLANAALNHPGDVLAAAGGLAVTAISGAGEGLGIGLDATGIGAVAGVPLNVVAAAGVATGAGMTVAAAGDLIHHAATDDQVSPVSRSNEPSGTPGKAGTKTDRLKEHLTDKDLDAARRELNGEVVATKSTGQPWDHVDEVQNAQRGLVNRINQLKRQLGDSRISDGDRSAVESELSEASRLLDYSEQFVPRG